MVKKARIEVAWDKMAYASFQQACDYIREESAVNAEKVRKEILKIIHSLPDHPEKYRRISSGKQPSCSGFYHRNNQMDHPKKPWPGHVLLGICSWRWSWRL